MQIARVVGNVVSTVKNETLHGRKFLIGQILGADLRPKRKPMAGVDTVGAGFHEKVIVVGDSSVRMAEGNKDCPVDSAIIDVIDTIDFIKQ
jgi:microcompartment protein CcmK/EutM